MSASAWMDRKVVMVMSTNCQPSDSSTVQRKQKDGSSVEVPCPASIISYNKFMGGVDRETRYADTIAADQEVGNFISIFFTFFLMWPLPTPISS